VRIKELSLLIHAHSSERQFRCRAFDHLPHDLMTWNELRPNRQQISFYDVQIRTTHSAGHDPKQNMPSFKLWTGHVLDMKE
jgi:hypothetical protein